jgi:hypothetical protein
MHSYLSLQLACQRDHELRAAAGRYRDGVAWRRGSVRQHVAWALVTIGLALARGSGEEA